MAVVAATVGLARRGSGLGPDAADGERGRTASVAHRPLVAGDRAGLGLSGEAALGTGVPWARPRRSRAEPCRRRSPTIRRSGRTDIGGILDRARASRARLIRSPAWDTS